VENDEIPPFIAGCVVDAPRWKVEGTHYDQWSSDYEGGDPFAAWRDTVVIPYLQRQFKALEVHEDGRLFGIRCDIEEEIEQSFYDRELLEEFAGQMSRTGMAVRFGMLS
jgi:hypothetical protein